jgi:hypothetical protein
MQGFLAALDGLLKALRALPSLWGGLQLATQYLHLQPSFSSQALALTELAAEIAAAAACRSCQQLWEVA